MHQKTIKQTKAFTLIELLVVIGLIGVLAAGIGVALKTNDGGTSLQAAQATVNSLISAARSQAALKNARAGVFVNVTTNTNDEASNGFLSTLRVAYENSSGKWVTTGTATSLPKGIFIVPGHGQFSSGSNVTLASSWPTTLPTAAISTVLKTDAGTEADTITDMRMQATGSETVGGNYQPLVVFTSGGLRSQTKEAAQGGTGPAWISSGDRIALAPAQLLSPAHISFENENNVLGLKIGTYGIVTFLNEKDAFHSDSSGGD
ncbi:pilus assembly FimT family protein [Geminisphaera colitermitum]|uniref:pilus assembly FimT family protein n=1 Tax=Geminisphaera colitermitum TaxID=1148786 RepID=UPI000158CDFF|nr:type II secretion system protein [Geminisphaera colitermitum]